MIERIYRVVRGGSWFYVPVILRASNRNRIVTDYRDLNLGFRLVVRIKDE